MAIKPIPKKLLIHTVTYEEWVEGDGIHSDSGFKPPVTLSNVRLQRLSNISKSTITEQLLFEAMLFFDAVNSSSSSAFTFTEKSIVTFNGQKMTVKKVSPVDAFSFHHYEIGLV